MLTAKLPTGESTLRFRKKYQILFQHKNFGQKTPALCFLGVALTGHKYRILTDNLDAVPRDLTVAVAAYKSEKPLSAVNNDRYQLSAFGIYLKIADIAQDRAVLYTDDLLFSHIDQSAKHNITFPLVKLMQKADSSFTLDLIEHSLFYARDLRLGDTDLLGDLHLGLALQKPQSQDLLFTVVKGMERVLERYLIGPV